MRLPSRVAATIAWEAYSPSFEGPRMWHESHCMFEQWFSLCMCVCVCDTPELEARRDKLLEMGEACS